ncbi:MAG: winged helix-turn-helix domain-containing protein [Dehalococcoidia bacterium]|nr:winged helix-turn-helix domain-containing protein [Dehalococcoidia bacterium]
MRVAAKATLGLGYAPMEQWTFLTNHAHVLLCIANDPGIRLREVAERVGITERAAQRLVADLVDEGYLTRTRVGRRNQYEVHPDLPFRHPNEGANDIGSLLQLLTVRDPK